MRFENITPADYGRPFNIKLAAPITYDWGMEEDSANAIAIGNCTRYKGKVFNLKQCSVELGQKDWFLQSKRHQKDWPNDVIPMRTRNNTMVIKETDLPRLREYYKLETQQEMNFNE